MAQHQRHQCRFCGRRGQLVRAKPCDCGGTLERNTRHERRPFPMAPLLWAAAKREISDDALRRLCTANTPTWTTAKVHGLTVWQADCWALRIGMHPVILWGDLWIQDSITLKDQAEIEFHVALHTLLEAEGLVA